jgi:hypothetical protein
MQRCNLRFLFSNFLTFCVLLIFSSFFLSEPTAAPAKDVPALVKKIGRTIYIVRVHFSKTSKETMSGKIKCMLKNEIQQM